MAGAGGAGAPARSCSAHPARIAAGPAFWVQVQHGPEANSNKRAELLGQYTHGDLGYGRCHEPHYTNDRFAVDYPMDRGDPIWSPFDCGRVTFAGRNETHVDYGIFVSIESCNGKYVSLTGHFSALRRGLSKGDRVGRNTVLGYAGKTGGPRIPVGQVHFHQVFYRYPKQNPDGSPYGGQGLQIIRHHYVGAAASRKDIRFCSHVYEYGKGQAGLRGLLTRRPDLRRGVQDQQLERFAKRVVSVSAVSSQSYAPGPSSVRTRLQPWRADARLSGPPARVPARA